MKQRLLLGFLSSVLVSSAYAQNNGVIVTGFGENAQVRNASAVLEAFSDDQGFLAPRLTLAQRNAIASPATSLLVYQTDNTPGYYYNSGTPGTPVWERLTVASGVLTGSGSPTRVAFWSGASSLSSNADLYWDNGTSRLGIGAGSPLGKLDIRVAGGSGAGKIYTGGDNNYPRIIMGGSSAAVAFVINRETAAATMYFGEDADGGGYQFRGTGGTRIGSLSGGGTRIVLTDNTGNLSATATLVGTGLGDNLGNHAATTTLDMNNNVINEVNYLELNNGFRWSQGGSNYGLFNSWLQSSGDHGLYWPSASGFSSAPHLHAGGMGDYGSLRIQGSRNGWSGLSLEGRYVLMTNSAAEVGLYNDVDNEWMISGTQNGGLYNYHNGTWRSQTTAGGLLINGNLQRTAHANGFLEGSYNNVGANDAQTNPIYTIGANYNPTATALSDMYGIGYSHSNFWGTANNRPSGWGQYVAADGDIRVILGAGSGQIWASGDVRAPIYYDMNDMAYYADPNGTSELNLITARTRATMGNSGLYNTPRHQNTTDTRYWTGSMGWGTTDLNDVANWGSGFIDTWGGPGNGPGTTNHYVGTQAFHYAGGGTSNYGWQMVGTTNANRWHLRSNWGGPWSGWVEMITTANIGSYGDNLGNHTATTTLNMNSQNISNVSDIYAVQNYGRGLVGVYDSYRYQNVFAMGTSYRLAANGTTPGNLYGLAWTHSNVGGQSKAGLGHQMLAMSNGVTTSAMGNGFWTNYTSYIPFIYDTDNTGFYLDPNSTSRTNVEITNDDYTYGWFRNYTAGQGLYSQATGRHFYSIDGNYWTLESPSGMIFRNGYQSTVNGYVYVSGGSFGLLSPNGSWKVRTDNSGGELYDVFYANDFRPYIIYDRNNTGYYADINSTSRMSSIHTDANLLNWPGYNGLAQAYAHYVWPGRNDGSGGAWQQSWYLASHSSYGLYTNTGLNFQGTLFAQGNTVIDAGGGWHRSYGATGWYNGTYGGGWFMQDGTYVTGYGNKTVRNDRGGAAAAYWNGDTYANGYWATETYSPGDYWYANYNRGYVYATTYGYLSTRKSKKDIRKFEKDDYESALAFMDDLDLNYYVSKDDALGTTRVGFIAEETPGNLTVPGKAGVLYGELGIYNTGAIRVLKKKVEDLEKQLSILSDFGIDVMSESKMWVAFSEDFSALIGNAVPAVVVTPSQLDASMSVSGISKDGFFAHLKGAIGTSFNWVAMASVEVKTPSEPEYSERFEAMLESAEYDANNRPLPKFTEKGEPVKEGATAPWSGTGFGKKVFVEEPVRNLEVGTSGVVGETLYAPGTIVPKDTAPAPVHVAGDAPMKEAPPSNDAGVSGSMSTFSVDKHREELIQRLETEKNTIVPSADEAPKGEPVSPSKVEHQSKDNH